MKKKYLFISNMASPYQVKFCYSLQKYFNAEFWFYTYIDETRPEWWKIPLGDKCKIMNASGRLPFIGGYFSLGLFLDLVRFRPDIIVLGGFMKWHWIVLKVAKLFKIKVTVMSESLRYVSNDDEQSSALMSKENSAKKIKSIRKSFKNADLFIGMGEVAAKQFMEEFEFPKEKVATTTYPQDIEEYYNHPLRDKNKQDIFRLLFANRLVDRYQPLFALEVLDKLNSKYPNIEMYMNNDGPLKSACIEFINNRGMKNVFFLDKIDSWNNMHLIYKKSDILILPATYSNGNGTIIEARASGMGIVVSNRINNIEDHSVNGKNCFICDLNVDEFVEAVSKYIDTPELLLTHGVLSREMVESRKNSNIARLYYNLIKDNKMLD